MILLSVMPCSDDLNAHEIAPTNKITKVAHGKQKSGEESCSPICACSCCGQTLITMKFLHLEIVIPSLILEKVLPHYQFSSQETNSTIWQPPKLA